MRAELANPATLSQNGYSNGDIGALSVNHMLHTLGEDEVDRLINAGRRVIFEPDETVSRQATPVSEILFIFVGRAKAEVYAPNSGSFAAVLNLLRPGDDIGLLSLIDGAPHSATVTALENLHALSIPMINMRNLLQTHVEWYQTLAEVAGSRLRNSSVWLQALM